MSIDKKNVLDLLYIAKVVIAEKAKSENLASYQLPEKDISRRNLAAGRSDAYQKSNGIVDMIIRDIVKMPEL